MIKNRMKDEDFLFDFNEMSLNSAVLGKEYPKGLDVLFEKKRGYQLGVSKGVINFISIFFTDNDYGFGKYKGKIKKDNFNILIDEESQPDDIKKIFGGDYDSWCDGVETNLNFIFKRFSVEFSWYRNADFFKLIYFSVEVNYEI